AWPEKKMLPGKRGENRRAIVEGTLAAAPQECKRPIFGELRTSGDGNIEHFDAACLADSPQLAGSLGRDGAHLDYDAARSSRRNYAIVAFVYSSDCVVIRQARHDHVRLHRERSQAWRRGGPLRC